jgi:hypothetical protein
MANTTTLNKIVAEAKRIQKVHTHMSWKEAIKDASKHIKEGAKTVVKKADRAKAVGSTNFEKLYTKLVKDYDKSGAWKVSSLEQYIQAKVNNAAKRKNYTELESLNEVLDMVKRDYSGSIEALPVNFVGSFWGFKFKIVNQYRLDGGVTAQLMELEAPGALIGELTGLKQEENRVIEALYNGAIYTAKSNPEEYKYSLHNDPKEEKKLKDKIKRFVILLNEDVKDFNSGKDKNITVSKPTVKELAAGKMPTVKRKKEFKPKVTTSKAGIVEQIKSVLKANHKILTHGYSIKPGKVRDKKIAGHEEDFEAIIEGWINEGKEMVVKQLAYYESKRYMANTKLEKNKIARKIYDLKKKFLKFKK